MPLKMDWTKGVPIDLKGAGGFNVVHSNHEAAVFLTSSYWPNMRGPAFERAMELVSESFDDAFDDIDDDVVRLAFQAAAEEAEISVLLH